MTYDDFIDRFGEPLQNEDNTILFETYGEDYNQVKAVDPNCVWTVVDAEGKLYLVPGLCYVNRVNYVIASTPRSRVDNDLWFLYGSV